MFKFYAKFFLFKFLFYFHSYLTYQPIRRLKSITKHAVTEYFSAQKKRTCAMMWSKYTHHQLTPPKIMNIQANFMVLNKRQAITIFFRLIWELKLKHEKEIEASQAACQTCSLPHYFDRREICFPLLFWIYGSLTKTPTSAGDHWLNPFFWHIRHIWKPKTFFSSSKIAFRTAFLKFS